MAAIISAAASATIALLTASLAVAVMSPPTGCATGALVFLSPCLPFISSPPNNLSTTAPPECCEAFSSVYYSAQSICLCYLLREPQFFGFPLNSSKLIALPSVCPNNGGMNSQLNSSLVSLCAASQSLPPLQSSRIPGFKEPDTSADENTPAPAVGLPPLTPPASAGESQPKPPTAKGLTLTKDCIGLFGLASLPILLSHFIHL